MMLLKNVYLNDKTQDIRLSGNLISKINNHLEPLPDEEVLNCKDKAILPSFCNTHTHAAMMFVRGVGEDQELFSWLNDHIWPIEAKLTPEMIYPLTKFAMLEMIKTGTTCFSDMYFFPPESVKAVDDMGLRAAISTVGMDFFDDKKTEEKIEEFEKFLSEKSPSERILKGISCHAIYTASEKLFLKAKELTRKYNTYLHAHSSESRKEITDCLEQHHCRPVELMNQWGVLDKNTILAHCLHISDNEIKIFQDTQTAVAHCPSSALKLNSGQMDFQKYFDAGMRLTIGTDGVASNNTLSMLTEMRIAALSGKNKAQNILAAKVNDVYAAATKNGFEFFGINAGEIKEGKLADFILVDLENTFVMPHHNLVSNMIYAADSSCISDVFCDGKQVMKNHQIKGEEEIKTEFKKVLKAVF